MLKIENLHAEVEGKKVLKGINLEIREGEKHVILGPNASGKSSLAFSILGLPRYKITEGRIYFMGRDITNLKPEERANLGIALAFQMPPEIEIKFSDLIRIIGKKPIKIPESLENRRLNLGLSGGEKKLSEVLQIIALDPKLAIFDEIEANLDLENFEKVLNLIKKEFRKKTCLFITHQEKLLEFVKPDWVEILIDGKIICKQRDWKKVLKTIKNFGYEKCKAKKCL